MPSCAKATNDLMLFSQTLWDSSIECMYMCAQIALGKSHVYVIVVDRQSCLSWVYNPPNVCSCCENQDNLLVLQQRICLVHA